MQIDFGCLTSVGIVEAMDSWMMILKKLNFLTAVPDTLWYSDEQQKDHFKHDKNYKSQSFTFYIKSFSSIVDLLFVYTTKFSQP